MAGFSSEEILDLLYKKVAFGANKSGTSEQFSPAGETSSSFIAVKPDAIWREASTSNVPGTPPATTSDYVQVIATHTGTQPASTTAVIQCTANADAQPMPNQTNFKRSWDTGAKNWIGPTFGAGYLVKVYVGPASWDGDTTDNTITQVIFGSDQNRDWYFDYEAGMLYWTPENENGDGSFEDSDSWTTFTDTHVVYIAGYRYIGAVGAGGTSDITGAASSIATTDLTVNRALISDGSGKVAVSAVTNTELAILDGLTSTTAELNILDGVTATAAELNILDGVTATAAELNILDGVTSTAAELNILDGVTSTAAELNILDGVTSTAGEINLLDGAVAGTVANGVAVIYGSAGEVNATTLQIAGTNITSTATELNVLDGITSTTAELNILDGVTATAAEINILDGVTATAAELNILDGVTSTAAELNILDGVTSTAGEINLLDGAVAGTVANGVAVIYGSAGEVNATTLQIGGTNITSTATELNVLDGITSTTAELNILDGVTATAAEINILDGVTATAAELNILDGVTSTAAELNILDGVTSTAAELNLLDGAVAGTVANGVAVIYGNSGEVNATTLQIGGTSITSTATELNVLDGITSTTAELNILDGVTATAAEINILDGVTATAAELNILDGVTATAAELNILDGVTATAAEINILDGVTSTAAELNILDGVTSTAAELNLLDGATANTVVNSVAVIYGSSGEVAATSLAVTNNVSIGGSLTVQGAFIQETSTNVIFEDTFLDLNVPDTATADITSDSGFRFGTGASVASVLDKHAQFTYDATNDLFKFTREADAGDFSAGQALSGADNVTALKFNKTDSNTQVDQANGTTTMNVAHEANAQSLRSLGAVAKCSITITNDTDNVGDNYAPAEAGAAGYPIKHNLGTQSVFVVAIKTHNSSGSLLADPVPVFCKYIPEDDNTIRVTVGITQSTEQYDIIVIG